MLRKGDSLRQADAIRILARLKAAFPAMALDEVQAEVQLREVALLHDPEILDEAVTNLIRSEDRFPSIAKVRLAYRSINDARAAHQAALKAAEPPDDRGVPTWVDVWWWARHTKDEKRTFPQCVDAMSDYELTKEWRQMSGSTAPGNIVSATSKRSDPEAMTVAEYEALEAGWRAAGCPSVSAQEVLGV